METNWWYIELCATLSCYCFKLLLKDSAAWRSTALPHRHHQACGGESSLHINILQNQGTDNTNGQSTYLIKILTIVLQMSFSWIMSQYLVAMSSYFLSIWDNSSVFLCFSWLWHFFKSTASYSVLCPSIWIVWLFPLNKIHIVHFWQECERNDLLSLSQWITGVVHDSDMSH